MATTLTERRETRSVYMKFLGDVVLIVAFIPLTMRFVIPYLGAQSHQTWPWSTTALVASTLTLWTIAMVCTAYASKLYKNGVLVLLGVAATTSGELLGGAVLFVSHHPVDGALFVLGAALIVTAIASSPASAEAKEERRLRQLANTREVWKLFIHVFADAKHLSADQLRVRSGYTMAETQAVLDRMVEVGLLRGDAWRGYSLKGGMPLRELGF